METQIAKVGITSKGLDGLTPQQLVSEIREISQQYEEEVPGRRRHWPESIRARILALSRLGVSRDKISKLTNISRATIFSWCRGLPRTKKSKMSDVTGKFIRVKECPTVRHTIASPTVGHEGPVSIVTPDGFKIEFGGTSGWQMACAVYRELRGGQ